MSGRSTVCGDVKIVVPFIVPLAGIVLTMKFVEVTEVVIPLVNSAQCVVKEKGKNSHNTTE